MSHSTNTRSGSTASKEALDIGPTTSPNSPYLSKSDLDKIQNDIKSITDKNHSYMKSSSNHISNMLAKISDTSSKAYNKEKELTYISSKLFPQIWG